MWPFKKRAGVDAERLDRLEKAVARVLDDLGELEDKHERLRGKVYAHKLHKPTEEAQDSRSESDPAKMSRAELKAWATRSGRITPGRPAHHTE